MKEGLSTLDGLEPGSPALEVIRQIFREETAAAQSPLVSTAEAMALTKHRSEFTFRDWCQAHGIRQVRQGVYSREAILRGIQRDVRRKSA